MLNKNNNKKSRIKLSIPPLGLWSTEVFLTAYIYRGVKLIFIGGHISLMVAFQGLKVILRLYQCNYSLTRGKELGAAAREELGARLDKTRWRAGFGPWALCLSPVI